MSVPVWVFQVQLFPSSHPHYVQYLKATSALEDHFRLEFYVNETVNCHDLSVLFKLWKLGKYYFLLLSDYIFYTSVSFIISNPSSSLPSTQAPAQHQPRPTQQARQESNQQPVPPLLPSFHNRPDTNCQTQSQKRHIIHSLSWTLPILSLVHW
jgi:hypothetical protein